ncbi:MAG: hypothetical protein AUK55_12405 [Syntrophobacteraceae bacterium CG2_30_61_12]|nr:MAG: hypothetical protein AUK55_12405 [Syntrophobacteraceae bacterium CG2_30_61_12]
MRVFHHGAGLLLPVLFLAACAPTPHPGAEEPPEPAAGVHEVGDIIDPAAHEKLSFDRFIDRIQDAAVIYLGETHGSPSDHQLQQRVIEALSQRLGPVTVAMEMFAQSEQEVLDRWSRGQLGEQAFIEQSHWAEQWGYPYPLYRGILELIRDRKLPLIGLNLPSRVAGKIAREGLAGLNPSERQRVAADLDRADERHREHLKQEFSAHPWGGIRDFESFYEAQLAWEETMAERLARELTAALSPRPILVIIGKGHVNGRFGVPERTLRRVEHHYRVVTTVPVEAAAVAGEVTEDLADFAWISEPTRVPHGRRALLGVMLEPLGENRGFRVVRVAAQGAGAAAGIREGDQLLRVDDLRVTSIGELRRQLESFSGYHTVLIRRGKQVLTLVALIRQEGNGNQDNAREGAGSAHPDQAPRRP